jgi:hypothetical protein
VLSESHPCSLIYDKNFKALKEKLILKGIYRDAQRSGQNGCKDSGLMGRDLRDFI